jgi:2-methylcitrate dehydratase PrpD
VRRTTRCIATAYEISGDLNKGIALHTHRIHHLLHIAAGMVAGIGAMLRLPVEVIHILQVRYAVARTVHPPPQEVLAGQL